jgi:hypothetical protein
MAAYPSYPIGLDSTQELEDQYEVDLDSSGGLHRRQFHSAQQYRFTLTHPGLTVTQWRSLLDTTYATDPTATHTLTYFVESPAVTYSVQFIGPPQIVTNHGNAKLDVRVVLRGTKD